MVADKSNTSYLLNISLTWIISLLLKRRVDWELPEAVASGLALATVKKKLITSQLIFFSSIRSTATVVHVMWQCDNNKERPQSVNSTLKIMGSCYACCLFFLFFVFLSMYCRNVCERSLNVAKSKSGFHRTLPRTVKRKEWNSQPAWKWSWEMAASPSSRLPINGRPIWSPSPTRRPGVY